MVTNGVNTAVIRARNAADFRPFEHNRDIMSIHEDVDKISFHNTSSRLASSFVSIATLTFVNCS